MRGSGSAPAATARRSARAPAQQIAWPASVTPREWEIRSERPAGTSSPTSQPVSIVPPAARRSSAKARATARKSTIPVAGECRAATPAACGSTSRMPSASRRRRPGTPFALPRRSSSSSPASSASVEATISLPQRSKGMPRSSQYSYRVAAPRTHSSAFSEPGA